MTTKQPLTFSNRHHSRVYPVGTTVEILATVDGWHHCRVVGTKSIKGWVKA